MKATEIRGMTVEEMNLKLEELTDNLMNLKMQHATKQLDNPNQLQGVRRDIARLKTILREQENPENKETKPKEEPK